MDALTGVDRLVGRIAASAEDAEIGPTGQTVYWIDAPAASGGVWRLDLKTGEQTRLLAPVQVASAPSGVALAAAVRPRADLAVSAAGHRLAATWCGTHSCLLQVADLGDGTLQELRYDETWHELLGFADDGVALSSQCADVAAARLGDGPCERPDRFARAAQLRSWVGAGVELPADWTIELVSMADAPPMSFLLDAVAVPANGGEPVPLEALGEFSGQG